MKKMKRKYANFIHTIKVIIIKIVHILCESCNELICDKCHHTSHKNHKVQIIDLAEDKDYILNIINLFYSKLKVTYEEKMINFKEKISDSEKVVDSFFNTELDKIETLSRDLTNLIDVLTIKVKKLVNLYRIKFKEQFNSARDEYDKFSHGIKDCKFMFI
jgi:hypothetical protein